MFWADKLLENRTGKEGVNDSFTPSGIVHMGSLKGPVIHDVLFRILKEKGADAKFTYGFDDADPIDGLPKDLQESHGKYLGIPLFIAPSPDGNGSFADYFIKKMKSLLNTLGVQAEIYRTSELYKKGAFNNAIKYSLDHAGEIRKVYSEIYKKEIPSDWYPLQVICPKCGKLGTTKVTGWDGKEVTFSCERDMVKWAQGCGFTGKLDPSNGNGKLPWKVEWAAKWWSFPVTIEGAGKDHASAGGSYDVAMKICEMVYRHQPPLKLAYEFFLSGGKKMSSSKGIGFTGEMLLEALPSQVARFLMIKTPPNRAVEFAPQGTNNIPILFDEYQKASEAFFNKSNDDMARAFELSQAGAIQKPPQIRFSQLAQWVQMPNMQDVIKKEGLEEWAKYAKVWIEKYAPESEKFTVQKNIPDAAKNLANEQKAFLKKVSQELQKEWEAEEFQKQLYEWTKELGISSKEAFSAIYQSLLGIDHGPKAGWLILSLDKEFVKERFEEAGFLSLRAIRRLAESAAISEIASSPSTIAQGPRNDRLNKPEIFSIDQKLKEKFPSISIGIAIIKGVHIEKTNKDLEKEKEEFLKSLEGLTTEQLGQYSEIVSYRKLYKEMGIDWHSKRPSPEALLRRIALKKGLYTVNTCVDVYNLVVMKQRISVGAFDLDRLIFPTVLRFAKEGEEIVLLGDDKPTAYKTTEIAYFDKTGGFNMDFNYRDAQRTAVGLETKNLYINVDGVFDITPEMVEQSLKETCDIITKYCGGNVEVFGIENTS